MNLTQFLLERGLAPHGYCLLWDPVLLWLHVASDAVIALSYFSIPIALMALLARRRDIEFGWMILLFGIFITACGTTHLLSILVLWVPAYGLEGLVKAITALASLLTAITIWPLLPKLLAIPSPRQLQLANEALRKEAAERALVEKQLRQAQKLEAIGQLTGGLAQDFNNILTVVMGGIERATAKIDDPAKATSALASAMEASRRAEFLTAQLLSFARNRTMIVERQDLNDIARDAGGLLKASVGETIAVVGRIAIDPLLVDIDRNQLEAALVNLALNARDAMPAGGTLTIATLAIGPGEVAIRVTDTGSGMDPATLERATEPFFTTKPVGQGTGLGLAQVYGFARAAGGTFTIASSPGEGTSVTITLPRR